MYCKYCGKEIDDNSSFCKHCGKAQEGVDRMSTLSQFLKCFSGKWGWVLYGAWMILNVYFLFTDYCNDTNMWEPFFPYGLFHNKELFANYDYSEFLVYVIIIPGTLYIVYKRRSSHSFNKKHLISGIVYIAWLIANLFLLMNGDRNYRHYNWSSLEEYGCTSLFYPFPPSDLAAYDYTEFVVYAFILPALLLFIYKRNRKSIDGFVKRLLTPNDRIMKEADAKIKDERPLGSPVP